jgi:hypothetical protein
MYECYICYRNFITKQQLVYHSDKCDNKLPESSPEESVIQNSDSLKLEGEHFLDNKEVYELKDFKKLQDEKLLLEYKLEDMYTIHIQDMKKKEEYYNDKIKSLNNDNTRILDKLEQDRVKECERVDLNKVKLRKQYVRKLAIIKLENDNIDQVMELEKSLRTLKENNILSLYSLQEQYKLDTQIHKESTKKLTYNNRLLSESVEELKKKLNTSSSEYNRFVINNSELKDRLDRLNIKLSSIVKEKDISLQDISFELEKSVEKYENNKVVIENIEKSRDKIEKNKIIAQKQVESLQSQLSKYVDVDKVLNEKHQEHIQKIQTLTKEVFSLKKTVKDDISKKNIMSEQSKQQCILHVKKKQEFITEKNKYISIIEQNKIKYDRNIIKLTDNIKELNQEVYSGKQNLNELNDINLKLIETSDKSRINYLNIIGTHKNTLDGKDNIVNKITNALKVSNELIIKLNKEIKKNSEIRVISDIKIEN